MLRRLLFSYGERDANNAFVKPIDSSLRLNEIKQQTINKTPTILPNKK